MAIRKPIDLYDQPEHRSIPIGNVEFRDSKDDSNTLVLTGYASTFEPYEMYGGPDKGGWIEQLDKRAFDKTLAGKPDLHLLINHAGMPLARTKSGTMDLSVDDKGLKVVARLDKRDPEVQALGVKMERGDMDEMSFAFRVKGQEWRSAPNFEDDPESLRCITEVSLHKGDVSVVNWGANPTTHAEVLSAPDLLRALVECDDLAEVRNDTDLVKRAMEKLEAGIAGSRPEIPAMPTGTLIDGALVAAETAQNLAMRAISYAGQEAGIGVGALLAAENRADMDSAAEVVAALDAVIDQACSLTCDVDRESLDPAVGQALDLIAGADSIVDQLMEALGICDPDDDADRSEVVELEAVALDPVEWLSALDADGLARVREILGIEARDDEPYGDVPYADPGYQKDGKKRYPIDSAEHVKSAWSYINQSKNAGEYTAEQLAEIKGKIKAAAKKFGIEIDDDKKSSESAPEARILSPRLAMALDD